MRQDQRGVVLFQSQKEDKARNFGDYAKTLYEQQDEVSKRRFPLAKPIREQAALKLEFANDSRIIELLLSQCFQRIDLRGSARWQITG